MTAFTYCTIRQKNVHMNNITLQIYEDHSMKIYKHHSVYMFMVKIASHDFF